MDRIVVSSTEERGGRQNRYTRKPGEAALLVNRAQSEQAVRRRPVARAPSTAIRRRQAAARVTGGPPLRFMPIAVPGVASGLWSSGSRGGIQALDLPIVSRSDTAAPV
jgi:hypothetical protein